MRHQVTDPTFQNRLGIWYYMCQLIPITCSGHDEWNNWVVVSGGVKQLRWGEPQSWPSSPAACKRPQHFRLHPPVQGPSRHKPRASLGTASSFFPNQVANKMCWAPHLWSCFRCKLRGLAAVDGCLRGTDIGCRPGEGNQYLSGLLSYFEHPPFSFLNRNTVAKEKAAI